MVVTDIDWDLYFKAKQFLVESFTKNPNYSFGDGSIMIEHSINVATIGLDLCVYHSYNPTLVAVGGLFHDIGKAMTIDNKPIDPKILRERHEDFNLPMMELFIDNYKIEGDIKNKLVNIFDHKDEILVNMIQDADITEFYMNFRLQKAFNDWANKQQLPKELQRKADTFNTMHLEEGKRVAKPFWEIMKLRWGLN